MAVGTSPNHGERRGGLRPTLIVLHYTGMATLAEARDRLCDPRHEVSAHWLLAEDGTLVAEMQGLSGHADADELFRWTGQIKPPGVCYLTHGEPDAAAALAKRLGDERGWNAVVPELHQSFVL